MSVPVRIISYFSYRDNAEMKCLKAKPRFVYVYNQQVNI